MSEVEVYEPPSHQVSIVDLAMLADRVARTSMVPRALRGKPDEVLAVMAYGNEVGFPPMQSLQLIDFLNDRPVPNSQGKRALILRAGHELWVEERTPEKALVCGRRKGEERVHSAIFTWQDAVTAGLSTKDTYRKHPADMLVARATSILARVAFADVLMGMAYDADELELTGPIPVEVQQGPSYVSANNVDAFLHACAAEEIDPAAAVRLATDGRTDNPAEVYTAEVPRLRDAVKALSPYAATADASEAAATERTPPDVQKLSDAQRRKIMALYNAVGVTERPDRLVLATSVVEREVGSVSDLSGAEAGRLIEALEAVEAGRRALVLGVEGSPVGVEA